MARKKAPPHHFTSPNGMVTPNPNLGRGYIPPTTPQTPATPTTPAPLPIPTTRRKQSAPKTSLHPKPQPPSANPGTDMVIWETLVNDRYKIVARSDPPPPPPPKKPTKAPLKARKRPGDGML